MLYFALVKSKVNKKLLKAIGKRVREIRENQGISQAQLAFESGIHRDQVGRIELGKQNPTISTLDAIADALNVQLKSWWVRRIRRTSLPLPCLPDRQA